MAFEAYITIEGTKHGKFHGESTRKGGGSQILHFQYPVEWLGGRDVGTGQSSGKRQYKPVQIVKEWGAASPQILAASAATESLIVTFQRLDYDFAANRATG